MGHFFLQGGTKDGVFNDLSGPNNRCMFVIKEGWYTVTLPFGVSSFWDTHRPLGGGSLIQHLQLSYTKKTGGSGNPANPEV